MSGDEQDSRMHENRCLDKEQLKNVDDKSSRNKSFSPYRTSTRPTYLGPGCSSKKPHLVHDTQRHVWRVLPSKNQKKFDAKQCDDSNETKVRRNDEQAKSKDMDIQEELNASSEFRSDSLPPLWFIQYMESVSAANVHTCIFILARIFPELIIYLHKMIVIYYSLDFCIAILILSFR